MLVVEQVSLPLGRSMTRDAWSTDIDTSYHPGQAIQKAVGAAAYEKLFGSGSLELIAEPADS